VAKTRIPLSVINNTMALIQGHSDTHSPTTRPSCQCSHLSQLDIVDRQQKMQTLWIALGLLSSFFVTELSISVWSHSLSLLADAGHLLSDVAALGLTLLANWLAQRPAAGQATFGYRRVEIFAALVNGLSLLAIAVFITCEAIARFQAPEPVLGLPMLIAATIGLIVNGLNITLLHQHSHNDLNLRGAFLHVVADAVSSIGIIFAAIAIYCLNWLWIDAVASLIVALLTGVSAIPLVQESLAILMEYAPSFIKPDEVTASLESFTNVESIEKLHIWTITTGQVMLCAHVRVKSLNIEQQENLLKQLQAHLHQNFGIEESILQITTSKHTETPDLHPLFKKNLVSLLSKPYKQD
jgi:cobalt-zinc-cadmium efflux system protein